MKKKENNRNRQNWVYIAVNPGNLKEVKIGRTENPHNRMKTLSGTSVSHDYILVYSKKVPNARVVEKALHYKFSEFRVERNKEFFTIPLQIAIDALIEEAGDEIKISTENEMVELITNSHQSLLFMGNNLEGLFNAILKIIPNKIAEGIRLQIILPELTTINESLLKKRDEMQGPRDGNQIQHYKQTIDWITKWQHLPKGNNIKLIKIPELPFAFIAMIDEETIFWTPYIPCGLSRHTVKLKVKRSAEENSHWMFLKKSIDATLGDQKLGFALQIPPKVYSTGTSPNNNGAHSNITDLTNYYVQSLNSVLQATPLDTQKLRTFLEEIEIKFNNPAYSFQPALALPIKEILCQEFTIDDQIYLDPIAGIIECMKREITSNKEWKQKYLDIINTVRNLAEKKFPTQETKYPTKISNQISFLGQILSDNFEENPSWNLFKVISKELVMKTTEYSFPSSMQNWIKKLSCAEHDRLLPLLTEVEEELPEHEQKQRWGEIRRYLAKILDQPNS